MKFVGYLGQIDFSPFPLYKHSIAAACFPSLHVGVKLLGLVAINNNAATGPGWHADSRKVHIQLVTVTQTRFLSC